MAVLLSKRKGWRPLAGVALVLGALVLGGAVLAACGGGDEGEEAATATEAAPATEGAGEATTAEAAEETAAADDGVTAAQAVVEETLQPVAWHTPGPAFTPASDLDGKKIYLIPNTTTSTFWQEVQRGLEEAGSSFGIEVVAFDPGGQIAEAARGIEEAIGQNADAIVIGSLPSAALAEPIKAATSAGIPVIVMFDVEEGPVTPEQQELGVYGNVGVCTTCLGEILAAYAVASTGGELTTASVTSPEIPPAKTQNDGYIAGVEEFCPDCTVEQVDVPLAEWSNQLGPAATSILADPAVNVMAPVWCDMVPLMVPAITAANAQGRINIVCQGANEQIMGLLAEGDFVKAVVGSPDAWYGWNAFDQVLRALSGQPPAEDSFLPIRLFTEANIGSVDLNASRDTWFEFDWRPDFEQLWGLS